VLWGFRQRWVAGLRGEYVTGNNGAFDAEDIFRGDRTRVSPNLTWYPSEFSKIRLQYNYDHGQDFGDGHSPGSNSNSNSAPRAAQILKDKYMTID